MSRLWLPVVLLLALPLAAPAAADVDDPFDARILLRPGEPPVIEGNATLVESFEADEGRRHEFALNLTQPYATIEVVVAPGTYDVERARQVVPTLRVPHEEYPLFTPIARDVRDVDGVPRYGLHNATREADGTLRIQLGLPGPREGFPDGPYHATLALERDVAPPNLDPGEIRDLTAIGFYQEVTTSELALVDLVVCCDPRGDEVHNPTTVHHFLHKFPIQGLDAGKTYRVHHVATDWAGNAARSEPVEVTTPERPRVPEPRVTPVSPAPNSSIGERLPLVEARIESDESPIEGGGTIRFFLDKKEVRENMAYENGTFRYRPTEPLARGVHSLGLEVTNAAGGTGRASWTFTVEDARAPAPSLPTLLATAAAVACALAWRRER